MLASEKSSPSSLCIRYTFRICSHTSIHLRPAQLPRRGLPLQFGAAPPLPLSPRWAAVRAGPRLTRAIMTLPSADASALTIIEVHSAPARGRALLARAASPAAADLRGRGGRVLAAAPHGPDAGGPCRERESSLLSQRWRARYRTTPGYRPARTALAPLPQNRRRACGSAARRCWSTRSRRRSRTSSCAPTPPPPPLSPTFCAPAPPAGEAARPACVLAHAPLGVPLAARMLSVL